MLQLTSREAKASVNPQGAWVEELTCDGQPLLFPKIELMNETGEKKSRGGMHVCLPNFGPGGESGLSQHGFGRISDWEVTHRDTDTVTLELQGPAPLYSSLQSKLTYILTGNSFMASLVLKNSGASVVRVAPGFHPYFFHRESETAVMINDRTYELDGLTEPEFIEAEAVTLKTSTRELKIRQSNLITWAIWTDELGNYVCVEPTYGGYRFLDIPRPDEHLTPGSERAFSCTISW